MPSLPALNQQREKLKPEVLEAVPAEFNDSVSRQEGAPPLTTDTAIWPPTGPPPLFSAV